VRWITVKGCVGENRKGEGIDGFVTKVGGDFFPFPVVVAFQEGDDKLWGIVVLVLFEARH
jgi:hypothetical protein